MTNAHVEDGFDDEGTLVVEQHFAIVPEWVIDADISDAAYRLYSVLPPSPPRAPHERRVHHQEVEEVLLRHLGDVDLGQVVDDVRAARRKAGLPVGLWNRRSIVAVLHESILEAGWLAGRGRPARPSWPWRSTRP
jgi:hypothetical protein